MRQRALTDGHPTGGGIYVVAILGLMYLVVVLVQLPRASRRGDFSIYYACAVAMHRGLNPYAINLTDFTRELGLEADPFAHPADTPTFTLVTEPLGLMSPSKAYAIWSIASAGCLIASLVLLVGSSARLDRKSAILLSLGAVGFTPLADNFRWAQSQTFVMFGVLLFFRLVQCGRDRAAGALLAALGLLRGFPLVLGGYLLSRRSWRAIPSLAVAFVGGAAATVATIGIAPIENFLRVIGVIGGHQWLSLEPRWEIAAANVSLDAFVARPLMLFFGTDLPRGLNLLHCAIVVSVQLVILATTFRATVNLKGDVQGRSLSLWIATMLILTPVVWLHYMVLPIITFGMIAVAGVHHEISPRVRRSAILGYAFVVLATPLMSTLTLRKDIFDWRTVAVAELGFLALLSAWFAAYRFATEAFSEASGKEGRRQAPPGS